MINFFRSEAMAVRDAVLSQSPEFKEVRIHAFDNATAVYDLLTIALVRWGQLKVLDEVSNPCIISNLSKCVPKLAQNEVRPVTSVLCLFFVCVTCLHYIV